MNDVALKNCPFCGSIDLNEYTLGECSQFGTRSNQMIQCKECKCEHQKKMWNTRPLSNEGVVCEHKTVEGPYDCPTCVSCGADALKIVEDNLSKQSKTVVWPDKTEHKKWCCISMNPICNCGSNSANEMHERFMQVINKDS